MLPYYSKEEISALNYGLAGKTAIITGATAGIGQATVEYFLAQGVNVVMSGRNPEIFNMAKAMGGDRAVAVQGDICDPAHREALVEAGVKAFGQVDILVNCAGIAILGNAEEIAEQDFAKVIEVNVTANYFMAQAVGQYMIANQIPGAIVNVSSQAGTIGLDKHSAYCASKGGVNMMTKVLAMEWGKYGIRVNAVSPTVVLTEMGKRAWDNPVGDAVKKEMPSERFAEPEEVASVIAFLCSKGASMITGHNLLVDGGYTVK